MQIAHRIPIIDINGLHRELQICIGDATDGHSIGPVDLLAISCFPDDYWPREGTIVGRLKAQGVDIGKFALRKEKDWRAKWQTWISINLPEDAGIRRLACFEHGDKVSPAAAVGNLFRAVSEWVLSSDSADLGVLRIPLLSTGDQRADKRSMLESITRQAYAHLRGALPVRAVQIVLYEKDPNLGALLLHTGILIEQTVTEWRMSKLAEVPTHDFFVSYRHHDRSLVQELVGHMKARRSDLKVFLDHQELAPGVFWKPELVAGIHNARHVLCFITDSYPDSAECVDEFHAALCCSRYRRGFLRPLLHLTKRELASLPSIFQKVNLIDASCPPRSMSDVMDDVLSAS